MVNAETALRQRSSMVRIVELDSLRGLAACVVILCHLRAPFISTNPQWYLRPIFDGHVSVVLFFVLSGYVLSLPFWSGREQVYSQYIIRRFFRIYVPYAAAVCFALIVGVHLIGARLPLTPWFYVTWHTSFTPRLIAAQFFTIDTGGKINIAFWSLRYEMEMSIVIPVICRILDRLSIKNELLVALGIEVIGFAGVHAFTKWSPRYEVFGTVVWTSCFLLGGLLARERETIARAYSNLSRFARLLFVVCTLGMFYCGHDEFAIPGACGVIILAQNSRAKAWLRSRVPEYLGRISYSLYLVHGTMIFAILILLYGRIPLWTLACLYLAGTLAASHLFCIGVEEPAMKLGKRLTITVRRLSGANSPASDERSSAEKGDGHSATPDSQISQPVDQWITGSAPEA